jgi:micrococcal nuclease
MSASFSPSQLQAVVRMVPTKWRPAMVVALLLLAIAGGYVVASPASTTVPEGVALVTKVIDGDTIDVRVGDRAERVRVLGINTPETVDPRRPVQCFGKEASDRLKTVLKGANVVLQHDSSQDDRDKYGRLLRYVELADGTDVGEAMVADGYAYEYTYGSPAYARQAAYRLAQATAQAQKRGLWDPVTCDGKK